MSADSAQQSVENARNSGRPHSDRDGSCICDYNPSTTDGPQEDCPFHGRPYAYWIERGDALAARLAAVEAVAARWDDVLAECKQADPRWILDRSVMGLDSTLTELRIALGAPLTRPGSGASSC